MNSSLVEQIADALLYEGYILYPYRPSAVKNQQRWNFGALCPPAYCEANPGAESFRMQTECLIQGNAGTSVNIKVRFLQLLQREVGWLRESETPDVYAGIDAVPALELDGKIIQSWQEAVEREIVLPPITMRNQDDIEPSSFRFPSSSEMEILKTDKSEKRKAAIVRRQESINGAVAVKLAWCPVKFNANGSSNTKLYKLTIEINNATPYDNSANKTREEALLHSLVSTHTVLQLENGKFLSLLDPPEVAREAASGCVNTGTYPVLVGDEGSSDCVLSSPIILYDYPQIAPESAGNLYDGTEIDEILTLRIMTLTDSEKQEMREADPRARRLLERTESLPIEEFMKMHGSMKGVK